MIILIQGKDRVGLVATIASILVERGINIISMREHVAKIEGLFFLRLEVKDGNAIELEKAIKSALPSDAVISINPIPEKKVIVLVTKEYHCLADILIRNYFKTLGATVQCVIGNHNILENICTHFDMPFYYISHEQITQEEFEQKIMAIIQQYQSDYIILAKFMRILSPQFVNSFPMRLINIHHSFLPAFIGANPYRQAFERGVKLIGATAHFVSAQLDNGPIIAQQIIPITHSFTTNNMMKAGQEIETAVLAKTLKLVFEDRVFVYGNKTVVFE